MSNRPTAAFLNLYIRDRNDVAHNIPSVVRLYEDTAVHRSLMEYARKRHAEAEASGQDVQPIKIEAYIRFNVVSGEIELEPQAPTEVPFTTVEDDEPETDVDRKIAALESRFDEKIEAMCNSLEKVIKEATGIQL